MSRGWVDDTPPPRRGPDTRDRRWVMRCDCFHVDHGKNAKGQLKRCPTEGEPSVTSPPLGPYAAAGWFIGALSDRCPDCLTAGHPTPDPHPIMTGGPDV